MAVRHQLLLPRTLDCPFSPMRWLLLLLWHQCLQLTPVDPHDTPKNARPPSKLYRPRIKCKQLYNLCPCHFSDTFELNISCAPRSITKAPYAFFNPILQMLVISMYAHFSLRCNHLKPIILSHMWLGANIPESIHIVLDGPSLQLKDKYCLSALWTCDSLGNTNVGPFLSFDLLINWQYHLTLVLRRDGPCR